MNEKAEVTQKIAELERYEDTADKAYDAIYEAKTEEQVLTLWHAMNAAKLERTAIEDWLKAHGYTVTLNADEHVYTVKKKKVREVIIIP